jgi:polyhydroxybutyrate depolymerase
MKNRMSVIAFFMGLCMVLQGCAFTRAASASQLPNGHQVLSLDVGGVKRQAWVHVPAGDDKTQPRPLVIMLHGMGGTAANAVRETGWSAKADAENFIVAYPDATRPDASEPANLRRNPQAWNDGSGRFHAGQQQVGDVAFIGLLIDRMLADYAVDRRRVYVTGFSNGASMAFRVGAELADKVAAIAPVAGASWAETLKPSRPISLLYLTGTADPLNPLDGGMPRMAFGGGGQGGRAKSPVQTEIARWAAALGLPAAPASDVTVNGVRTTRYGSGANQTEVVLITVDGLGHIWAGGQNLLPEFIVGKPTDKLRATDVSWEFFKAHPVP